MTAGALSHVGRIRRRRRLPEGEYLEAESTPRLQLHQRRVDGVPRDGPDVLSNQLSTGFAFLSDNSPRRLNLALRRLGMLFCNTTGDTFPSFDPLWPIR
jgi:hypothetical protein